VNARCSEARRGVLADQPAANDNAIPRRFVDRSGSTRATARACRFPGEQRTFHRFSDLTNEVLEARIWAGIHFRNPDVQAANLGRGVERSIHTHSFAAARKLDGLRNAPRARSRTSVFQLISGRR
jgi:hypothetical protein